MKTLFSRKTDQIDAISVLVQTVSLLRWKIAREPLWKATLDDLIAVEGP